MAILQASGGLASAANAKIHPLAATFGGVSDT
jgi:hypothetical protein